MIASVIKITAAVNWWYLSSTKLIFVVPGRGEEFPYEQVVDVWRPA